jgi:acyl-CoA thioesterase
MTAAPWGDVADLVGLLEGRPRPGGHRGIVEGSQLLGQTLVAAMRRSPGRRVVHAAMTFPRPADNAAPVTVDLEPISDGRSFTTLAARVVQADRVCALGTVLLDAGAPAVIRHAAAAPDVPGPAGCPAYDMAVTGRELRVVDGAYTGDPDAPVGPPEIGVWVRLDDVGDDPALHAGLLAQFTGHVSIAAALRPHAGIGQDQAHRSLSTAINAITLALHAAPRVDDWLLYHHVSTFAGDGMTHSECRVFTAAGELVASFTVEAMVREMPAGTGTDPRTAL